MPIRKNLFIDTNIYLTFYHFSTDDLEELKKLSVAIEGDRINLYITDQVKNEFRRNRETKIADALKKFNEQVLPNKFPQICIAYSEYEEMKRQLKEYEKNKQQLLERIREDIDNNKCGADEVIDKLFDVAERIKQTDELLHKAMIRADLGNPPGKKDSYGDAINWQSLIEVLPMNEDLYLVSDDQDYTSKINRSRLAEYLIKEWRENKNAEVHYYLRLSEFLHQEFPEIKFATELEKEIAIKDLINSENFEQTHNTIRKLSKFTDLSNIEVIEMVEAAITNNQIYWINTDSDVYNFFSNLVNENESILPDDLLSEYKKIYEETDDEF